MDANGIGTDATMAEHIAKIKEREYVLTQARGGGGGSGRGGGGNAVQQFIPTTLGVALIEGYDNIGLETSLGKPFLRKEMELKMKEICAGTKSRNDFVQETLEQYKGVFVRTQQQVAVLRAVSLPPLSIVVMCLCADSLYVANVGVPEICVWDTALRINHEAHCLLLQRCTYLLTGCYTPYWLYRSWPQGGHTY
jgi:hypothetical protein